MAEWSGHLVILILITLSYCLIRLSIVPRQLLVPQEQFFRHRSMLLLFACFMLLILEPRFRCRSLAFDTNNVPVLRPLANAYNG